MTAVGSIVGTGPRRTAALAMKPMRSGTRRPRSDRDWLLPPTGGGTRLPPTAAEGVFLFLAIPGTRRIVRDCPHFWGLCGAGVGTLGQGAGFARLALPLRPRPVVAIEYSSFCFSRLRLYLRGDCSRRSERTTGRSRSRGRPRRSTEFEFRFFGFNIRADFAEPLGRASEFRHGLERRATRNLKWRYIF